MALVMAGLQDLAWLRLNAARRDEVPTFKWATVHTSSPGLTVILDGDDDQRPRQVSGNAVGPLVAGQRVRVELQGTRVTVTAAQMSGFLMPDGSVHVAAGATGGEMVLDGDAFSFGGRWSGGQSAEFRSYGGAGEAEIVNSHGARIALTNDGSVVVGGNGNAGGALVTHPSGVYLTNNGWSGYDNRILVDNNGIYMATNQARNASQDRWRFSHANDVNRLQFQGGFSNMPAGTGSPNIYMVSNGFIAATGSLRALKHDIADLPVDEDKYLSLRPRDWVDKAALAGYSGDADTAMASESVPGSLRRIPGLIAEEVAEDNDWLATYGEDGELLGVAYDRGWIPAIPIIKRLRDQVAEQESRILALENKVDQLMSLLHDQQEEEESHG